MVIESLSLINFYILIEILNIITYTFIGFNSYKYLNFRSNILYYLIGFISSVLFLTGVYFYYCFGLSEISSIFIWTGLMVKMGSFPFSLWVIPVYNGLSNASFIFFISILKLNYLNLLVVYILKFSYAQILHYLLIYIIVGTLFMSSFILIKQCTFKGFIAATSILNLTLILLSILTICNYSSYILFKEIVVRNCIFLYLYLNIYIVGGLVLFLIWKSFQSEGKLEIYNKNFIQPLFNALLHFKDNYLIVAIWILGGFPPFLLFISKFYILYYSIWLNNIWLTFFILFLLSSIGLYGYAKFITSVLIKLKYNK